MKHSWTPETPHQALSKLPPRHDLETRRVLRTCIGARAALAELKQAIDLIPEPGVLLGWLPVLEARASSEIENIVTTADELFRQLEAEPASITDPATREALRYREALVEGTHLLGECPLGFRTARQICTRVQGAEMDLRKLPGIAIGNAATREVIYTPPTGEQLLRDLLSNWESFLHGDDELDPLVRMAVAHYQFEAIHPFTDGNGRTGRILNSLFLVESGLLGAPVLYLSRYIVDHKLEYYRLLLDVTKEGAWEAWLLYMLEAVAETSLWTLAKIGSIRTLIEDTGDHLRARLPKLYSKDLVEQLFARPYVRIPHIVTAGIAKRGTASSYLKSLVRIGILEQEVHGREKLFVNSRFLRLLTEETNSYPAFE